MSEDGAAPLTERTVEHDGQRLRYLTGGTGPAMLLCHGFIGSAENFSDWFPALLARRTVIVPDMPGFGRSSPLRGTHDADALARAALRAADDAGVDSFDVAGLCLGACVALAVQRLQPHRVRGVVLHTPLLAPWLVRRRFHAQTAVMLAPGVFPGIVWLSRQRVVSDLYKRLFIEGSDVDPAAATVNFENQLRAAPRAAREWLRDGLRRHDVAQLVGGTAPALVLVAAQDLIVDVPKLRRALLGVPHVQLAVIDEGGHAWNQTMIEQQRTLLGTFLDGASVASGSAA